MLENYIQATVTIESQVNYMAVEPKKFWVRLNRSGYEGLAELQRRFTSFEKEKTSLWFFRTKGLVVPSLSQIV